MASVNKVILLGHLGRDPETRYAQSGSAIANVTIATSRVWKDKASGEKQEEVEWSRLVFFDRLAEVAQQYLHKGDPVYVEGYLRTRKWTDKEGIERYTTEIVCNSMQLLGTKQRSEDQQAPAPAPRAAAPAPRPAQQHAFNDMDDDIPF